uniref:D-xylose 1-dehydrogenase (NADP(+), D-xylono-1,5-lactone-forming) n=1 Tax=Rhodosorus marinus TaxID=101924 RepID=A0A7S0BSK5_9RHOD
MANDGDFDIMYVGTLHQFHREHAQGALEAGKNVLVEKPFTTTLDDALALTELAEKKGLFITEGLWTRYFPAVEHALHMVRGGSLGEVKQVEADFCFNAADGDAGVLLDKELAGGANFYVSIYSLGYTTAVFGTEPEKILATGHVMEGVDLNNVVVLQYAEAKTGIAISGMQVESAEEVRISGTRGRITIHTPSHCATSATFCLKLEGRGNVEYEHKKNYSKASNVRVTNPQRVVSVPS